MFKRGIYTQPPKMLTLARIAASLPDDESRKTLGPYASYIKKLGVVGYDEKKTGLLPFMGDALGTATRLRAQGVLRKDAANVFKALKYCGEKGVKYLGGDAEVMAVLGDARVMKALRGYNHEVLDRVYVEKEKEIEDELPPDVEEVEVTDLSSDGVDEDEEDDEGEEDREDVEEETEEEEHEDIGDGKSCENLEIKYNKLQERVAFLEELLGEVLNALPNSGSVCKFLYERAMNGK